MHMLEEERSEVNNLNFHPGKLEKEKQIKSKVNRKNK